MQLAMASSFDYAVFTFSVDDAGAINIPIGVALWSPQQRYVKIRLVEVHEKLGRFRGSENHSIVNLVREKISQWMTPGRLPYAQTPWEAYQTEWWKHARNLLVHRIRLSEPRPVDCSDPEQELEPLYESIVSPFRAPRERQSRVDVVIRNCLNGLSTKFQRKQELPGYGERKVRVLRSFQGATGAVVIEGVNLATEQAEQQSDAVVSRLLRLKAALKDVDILVGYLTSPEGINGEKVLVDWIEHQTGAKAFDLLRQRQEFRLEAGNLVTKASMNLNS